MGSLVEIGLANALVAGVLAGVALVAGRWSRRPALVHVLWLLVLIKLVTPPLFTLPIPSFGKQPVVSPPVKPTSTDEQMPSRSTEVRRSPETPRRSQEPSTTPTTMPTFTRIEDLVAQKMAAPAPAALAPAAPMMPAISMTPPPPRPSEPPPPEAPVALVQERTVDQQEQGVVKASAPPSQNRWEEVVRLVGAVWIGGAVVWLFIALVRVVRFQHLLQHAKDAPALLQEEADRIAAKLGLKRCPRLWLIPGPVPPLLWTVGGPARLFFPETLLPRLEQPERATLLAHELAHLARRDHWVRYLELFVAALYWWYPLVWFACRKLQAAEEECCDAWVVNAMPGYGTAYAGALLETVDFLAEQPAALPPAASGFGQVHHLKRRLTMIVKGAPPRGLSLIGKCLVLALMVALPLAPGRARPAAPPVAEQTEETTPRTAVASRSATPTLTGERTSVAYTFEEPERYQNTPRVMQGGAGGQVWASAISPDGKTLAVVAGGTGDNEGALTLYDLASGMERVTLTEIKPIRCVAFSPDGKLLATGDFAFKVQIRDPKTGVVLRVLDGHTGAVNSVAFTPDSKMLATGSLDKSIRLWDLATGKATKTLTGHTNWVLSVAVSADGKTIASASNDQTGRIWDLASGKELHVLKGHTTWVEGVAFSPDSKIVATTGHDAVVKMWDVATGKHLRDCTGHSTVVNTAVFFPDGKTLATCSHDQTVRFWDVTTGTLSSTLATGHTERIYALSISPDARTLVSGSWDKVVKVWDVATREERRALTPKRYQPETNYPILSLAVSPDGKTLAVSGEERAVKLLDPTTGQLKTLLEGHEDIVARVVFSPDSKTLASACFDGTIKLWDVPSGKCLHTLKGHASWVFTVAFSSDGTKLASGGYDKSVRLWDPKTGKQLASLEKHRGGVRAVAFAPDGKRLASGGTDKAIRIWDLASRECVQTIKGHEDAVRELAFAPNGRLASGSEDTTIRLWDIRDGKQLASHKGNDVVRSIAFSPQGRKLMMVDQARTIRLLDVPSLTQAWTVGSPFADSPTSVAFSPDARHVYIGSLDRSIRVWQGQVTPKQPIASFPVVNRQWFNVLPAGDKQMWFAAHSPDGKWLAWGGQDLVLRVQNPHFGRLAGLLEEAPSGVLGLAVSPDGKILATGCFDGSIRLYDMKTRKLLDTLAGYKDRVWTVAFSPDGKKLAGASGSWPNPDQAGEVKVWDLSTKKEILDLKGIESSAQAIAWSRTGKWLAVGTRDGLARLYDAATGALRQTMTGHKESVRLAAFSPDDRFLATAGADDATVRIWQVESGKKIAQLAGHKSGVNCIDWSPDGKMLAGTSRPRNNPNPGEIRLWTVAETEGKLTFKLKTILLGHKNHCLTCAFSPDGKLLASGGGIYAEYGESIVWDIDTGKQLVTMHGHQRWVEAVLFSKDGKTLITAGGTHNSGGEVRFWNVGAQAGWSVAKAHTGQICCAAWSRDGKTLATGSYDRTIKLWEASTGKLLTTFTDAHKKHLRCLAFSPDGKMLASSSNDETVKLWDLEANKEMAELARHSLQVTSVAFSPDGKLLATASGHTTKGDPAGDVRVFEVDTGKERQKADWSGKGATSVAFSPDGKHLVTGALGAHTLRVYSVETGKLVKQVQNANSIRVVTFSPDGKLLATCHGTGSTYGEGSIQVWDTTTWTAKASLTGHAKLVLGMSFAADSRHLSSASNDGTMKLWDIQATRANPAGLMAVRKP